MHTLMTDWCHASKLRNSHTYTLTNCNNSNIMCHHTIIVKVNENVFYRQNFNAWTFSKLYSLSQYFHIICRYFWMEDSVHKAISVQHLAQMVFIQRIEHLQACLWKACEWIFTQMSNLPRITVSFLLSF